MMFVCLTVAKVFDMVLDLGAGSCSVRRPVDEERMTDVRPLVEVCALCASILLVSCQDRMSSRSRSCVFSRPITCTTSHTAVDRQSSMANCGDLGGDV